MADQAQRGGRRKTPRHDPGSGTRRQENSAPSPTDMDFFRDPLIYKQGGGTRKIPAGHGAKSGRPDQEIKDEIERLMAFQKTMDASAIRVTVEQGVVTLSGEVSSQYDKQVAENITRNVFGIREVENRLTITGPA